MEIQGRTIALFVDKLYEDLEVWYPLLRFQEECAQVVVAAEAGKVYESKHGYPIKSQRAYNEVHRQMPKQHPIAGLLGAAGMCCGMVSWNRNVDAQRRLYRLRSGLNLQSRTKAEAEGNASPRLIRRSVYPISPPCARRLFHSRCKCTPSVPCR